MTKKQEQAQHKLKEKGEKRVEKKIEQGQDHLKCVLNDQELLEYGRKQAQALSDIARAEDDFKSFQTAIKNKIATLQATVNDVSEKIRTGYEFRFVPITIWTDYDGGLVSFTRQDTEEIYHQRPLNSEEKQFLLDLNENGLP